MGTEGRAELRLKAIRIRRKGKRGLPGVLLQLCLSFHRQYRPISKDLRVCDAVVCRRYFVKELRQPREVKIPVQVIVPGMYFISDYQAQSQTQGLSRKYSTPRPRRLNDILQKIVSEILMDRKASKSPHVSSVTVGRVSTFCLLDVCGNHGQLFGSLIQAFHAESASL
jgi:hypothetical protein